MNSPVRILSISDDDGLRLSRELLLKSDGHEVQSVSSNIALSGSIAGSFDIALICRSVDPDSALPLAAVLRHDNPDIRILRIAPLDQTHRCEVDAEISSGPESLLEAIRNLCNQLAAAG